MNFWKCAVIRAIRTMAQTAVATIGSAVVIEAVDWRIVLSASLLAGVLSILTSIATGLPEVEEIGEDEDEDDDDYIPIEADPEDVRDDIEVKDEKEEEREEDKEEDNA